MEQGQSRPDILIHHKAPGDPTELAAVAVLAYSRVPELQHRPLQEFLGHIVDTTEALHRVELELVVDGQQVGAAVLVPEEDMHVGPCVSVFWNYVAEEHRHLGFVQAVFRTLKAVARSMGIGMVAYTHRKSEGRYITQYRRT